MKVALPAFCYLRKRGKYSYVYLERGGGSVRIKAEPGTPEFAREYALALTGAKQVPTGKTFNALIASYRRSKRWNKLAPRTRRDYETVLTFVADRLGNLPPDRMQQKDVIRAQLDNGGRFGDYIVQVLRILFAHAISIGWMQINPAKGVMMDRDTTEKFPWPDDLIAAYRAKATGRALLIFELCLGTGQRIGDVLRMRWNDVQDGGIKVRQGKTGARLWIPLTGALRAALDATPKRGMTIVAQANGLATSYRGASDMVMKVRREIGAEAYDIHALRRTAASELAEAGCSDELIMAVTGHSSAAMVKLYAGPARQKARAIEAQGRRE